MIEMTNQHRVLGLIIEERMNWKEHLKETKAREMKNLNLLKTLSHKTWGSDQEMLLRIHQMAILSNFKVRVDGIRSVTKGSKIEYGKCRDTNTNQRIPSDIRNFFCDMKIHNENVLKTNTPTQIITRTAEFLGKYNINTRKISTTPTHSRARWSVNTNEKLVFTLFKMKKGTSTLQIRA
jgi:hypothetical protein